jgi:uncharacterized GH25 family protein
MQWKAFVAALIFVGSARAHFVFILPEADGRAAKVVFSDRLETDDRVTMDKLTDLKLTLRRAGHPDAPVTWAKGQHCFDLPIRGDGPRQVFGTVEYGVMQRGEGKPFLLIYHPKAIVGDPAGVQPLGDAVPVEIVPVRGDGGWRFRVLARGKPRADAEVTILSPGETDSKKVKTNAEGLTPAYSASGRYGAWTTLSEPKSGEHGGKKHDEIRHYATVVATLP